MSNSLGDFIQIAYGRGTGYVSHPLMPTLYHLSMFLFWVCGFPVKKDESTWSSSALSIDIIELVNLLCQRKDDSFP